MKPFSLLAGYLGGGGYIQLTPNTPKELEFGDKKLSFKELWGRVSVSESKAIIEFDDVKPKPTFSTTVLGFNVSGTITGLEITDSEIVAVTSLGRHSIWKQTQGVSSAKS